MPTSACSIFDEIGTFYAQMTFGNSDVWPKMCQSFQEDCRWFTDDPEIKTACKFSQTNYFEKKSPRNCSFDFELPESLVMFMQLSGKVRKKSDARIDYRANWNMNFKSATQRKTIKILSNTTFTNPKSPFLILILSISSCQS